MSKFKSTPTVAQFRLVGKYIKQADPETVEFLKSSGDPTDLVSLGKYMWGADYEGFCRTLEDAQEASMRRNPGVPVTGSPRLFGQLQELLSLLIAMERMYQTAHWQSKGPSFQGDHTLFSGLYTGVDAEYDTLAEKIVASLGGHAVNDVPIGQMVQEYLVRWSQIPDLVLRGLQAEEDLQAQVATVLHDKAKVSEGLQNFLQGVADAHEKNAYLLTQRAGGR